MSSLRRLSARVRAVLLRRGPLGCRMTLAFDRVDLTLGLLDGGGGGLEAVDESPLDRVGELDSTNQL